MKGTKKPEELLAFINELTASENFMNESYVDSGHFSRFLPEHSLILHHFGISANRGSFLVPSASAMDYFNVNFVLEGSLRLDGKYDRILHKGDIFFSSSENDFHVCDDRSRMTKWMYFSLYKTVGSVMFREHELYSDARILQVPHPERLEEILWKVMAMLKENREEGLPRISALLYEFFMELHFQFSTTRKGCSWDILSSRIRRPPFITSANQLADEMGLPLRVFSRKFKEHFGTSPKKYLSESRLAYASYLLIQESYAISEIADLCGYVDSAHFIHDFKRHTGYSPDQYRHMKKKIPSAFQHSILLSRAGGSNPHIKNGSKELSPRRQEILYLLRHNNKLSQRKLAKTLKINVSAVESHLSFLKKNGFLQRMGSSRGGYWIVMPPQYG